MLTIWFKEVKKMKKKITGLLTIICLVVFCFFGLTSAAAGLVQQSHDVASSPVVTIAFDDGMSSQYQYAYPLMKAKGITGTFYITANLVKDISGNYKFMSFSEILDLQNEGNEIGSHSLTHSSFTSLTETQIRHECSMSKSVLEDHGLRVENFAYPYGETNDFVDSIVSQYYRSARTAYTSPYTMSFPISQFRLTAFAGETGNSNALPRLKNILDQLTANQWIIIFFHKTEPNVSDQPYTISTQDFEKFLDYIVLKRIKTLTVSQALGLSPPSPPPEPEPEQPVSPNTTNLLGNPSVEIDGNLNGIPDSWSFYKTSGISATSSWVSEFHTAQKGIKISVTYTSVTNQKESALWYQQISKIIVGETYSFRVWYKSNVQSTILLLTYSGSSIVKVVSLNLSPSSSWVQSNWLRTTIPSGATSLRADCRLFNIGTGWVIFDDLEVVSSIQQEPIQQEPTTPTPSGNILLNPSVEIDKDGLPVSWTYYKTSGMKASLEWTNDFYSGQKAVKITATYNPSASQKESALWHQSVTQISVGKTYKFRVWYKSSVQSSILLLAFGSSSLLRVVLLDLPISNLWIQSEWISITIPSGTTSLRVDARIFNRDNGWTVFDNFELVEL